MCQIFLWFIILISLCYATEIDIGFDGQNVCSNTIFSDTLGLVGRNKFKTITVPSFKKKIRHCCSGYEINENKTKCIPACENGCQNGSCIKTNICDCQIGWYGSKCERQMSKCSNNGKFNTTSGKCSCSPGYYASHCENWCANGTYGNNCKNICKCKNNARCLHTNGSCTCKAGWIGKNCDKPKICECKNNGSCHPENDFCKCQAGFKGQYCEKTCGSEYFGVNCSRKCDCSIKFNDCDSITGQCICPKGYYGPKCEKPCLEGYFGENCIKKCNCINNSTCSSEIGICHCNSGYIGIKCEFICPPGFYGDKCTGDCKCNDYNCHHERGCISFSESLYKLLIDHQKNIIITLATIFLFILSILYVSCVLQRRKKHLQPNTLITYEDDNDLECKTNQKSKFSILNPNLISEEPPSVKNIENPLCEIKLKAQLNKRYDYDTIKINYNDVI